MCDRNVVPTSCTPDSPHRYTDWLAYKDDSFFKSGSEDECMSDDNNEAAMTSSRTPESPHRYTDWLAYKDDSFFRSGSEDECFSDANDDQTSQCERGAISGTAEDSSCTLS